MMEKDMSKELAYAQYGPNTKRSHSTGAHMNDMGGLEIQGTNGLGGKVSYAVVRRGPTKLSTHAKKLTAAGYLVISPGTSLWRRLVMAWRGGT